MIFISLAVKAAVDAADWSAGSPVNNNEIILQVCSAAMCCNMKRVKQTHLRFLFF